MVVPGLHRHDRRTVAGLHGAAVHHDEELGLTNSFTSLILLQAFGAFGVFLMRQYYMTIPDELCEAAASTG